MSEFAKRPADLITPTAALPVAVIGAGPVGLAAAAHLHRRGLPFVVLEAGPAAGTAVRDWAHVRFFSPWRFSTDPVARDLLAGAGWQEPPARTLPTGGELVASYLQPLARHPAIAPHVRYDSVVVGIARAGVDRVRTGGRGTSPFVIRLDDDSEISAAAVIDAGGTWRTPNPLGATGLPARGERRLGDRLDRAMPDVAGAERGRFAGRHTMVVGAGHSAANTLIALAELAREEPGTAITWALRRDDAERAYGGGEADELAARGALGCHLRELVETGRAQLLTGFAVVAVAETADGRLAVTGQGTDGGETTTVVDRVVAATGYRPDFGIAAELRLDLDPVLESTRALAALIDPNEHSCGTVPPHGIAELGHPEPGYYAVGMKSYGRAPTFLLAAGYEQVRSVVAGLAGDWASARGVELELPETGVCCTDEAAPPAGGPQLLSVGEPTRGGCC